MGRSTKRPIYNSPGQLSKFQVTNQAFSHDSDFRSETKYRSQASPDVVINVHMPLKIV
jgi:hypothetical protein